MEKTDKIIVFKEKLFTFQKYKYLKITLLTLSILLIVCIFFIRHINNRVFLGLKFLKSALNDFLKKLSTSYPHLSTPQKRIFFLLLTALFILRLPFAFYFMPLVDEAFSYVYFVSQGMLVSMSYYPGPNNHICFNLIASLLNPLTSQIFYEPVLLLRLISVLASLTCSIFFFFWLFHTFNFRVAFWGIILFNLQVPFFTYSFLGRGYVLQLCLLILVLIIGIRLVQPKPAIILAPIFTLTASLGFYCIPTFLYPYFALNVYFAWYLYFEFKIQLLYRILFINLNVIGLTIILYAPVLLLQGWRAVSGNSWVKPLRYGEFFERLPAYLNEFGNFFWDKWSLIAWILFGVFMIIYSILIFFKPSQNSFLNQSNILLFLLMIIPVPLLLIQKVLPFPRVWMYFSLPMTFMFIYLTNFFFQKKETLILSLLSIIQLLILLQVFNSGLQSSDYQKIAQKIVQQKPENIFVNEDTYLTFIRYEGLKAKQNLTIDTHHFNPQKHYQWLILYANSPFQEQIKLDSYQLFYQDKQVFIYQKNN